MLLEIKDIKEFKLDRAQKELQTVQMKLAALREDYVSAVDALAEHIEWRQDVEDKLYSDIELRLMKANALDDIREAVATMHQQDASYRQSILDIEFQIEQTVTQRKECQATVNLAEKNVEKYRELLKEKSKEDFINQERHAENLLDEFSSAINPRGIS